MSNSLFRKKDIQATVKEAAEGNGDGHGGGMHRVLNVRDLTFLGIAAVVGAGIFSTIGTAASNGGPGISLLFVITAVTCGFSALCYAEFASRVPISGSAYTYAYVSFGELIAWIIGWALILEYAIGNIVVAISWSSYFNNLLEGFNIHLPGWLTSNHSAAQAAFQSAQDKMAAGIALDSRMSQAIEAWNSAPVLMGKKLFLNFPAFIIVILITWLTYVGIKESKKSANFMVIFKVAVIIFVIILGFFFVKPANWSPFLPHGFEGVLKGVSAVFYAYIGFDAISTTAEECKNPQRDMPRGMIYSLIICTVLYILIALVLTGMVNFSELNVADPLAFVFEQNNLKWIGYIISISAVVATTSVLLVFQLGQPRIWMSMSRDGLLPKVFSKIHPRFQTPAFSTILTGLIVAVPSLFMDASLVTDLTSIGTLFAFVLVSAGVLTLARQKRDPGAKGFYLPYINGKFLIPLLFAGFMVLFWPRLMNAVDYNLRGQKLERNAILGVSTLPAFDSTVIAGKDTLSGGVMVKEVPAGSSGSRMGLKPGDFIHTVNDFTLNSQAGTDSLLKNLSEHESLNVHLVRDGKLKRDSLVKGAQENLFLIFVVMALLLSVFTLLRNYSIIPVLGVMFCLYLLIEIPVKSWWVFFGWMGFGLIIYFLYGYRKSRLAGK